MVEQLSEMIQEILETSRLNTAIEFDYNEHDLFFCGNEIPRRNALYHSPIRYEKGAVGK